MEYKALISEMRDLVAQKKFSEVNSVGEDINWHKVNNINDLMIGAEAYEKAGNSEAARDLLLLAHERSPIGRMIIYKLSMISLKLGEVDEAQEYYNEFVQVAPHDSMKHILKYNISVAKGADTATLIKILEQLKDSDFMEEWAYELAYLYHKTNQGDKCIALCNEIILWFGDGPVVERALELKMLYQPLDKVQENKYRDFQQKKDEIVEITPAAIDVPKVKPVPVANPAKEKFNTINLQAEIKKNIDEIMKATERGEVIENIGNIKSLVEEIPYLQVSEENELKEEAVEFSINDKFQTYLEEGFDGQLSLRLPDDTSTTEQQIEGQMTIEDVLAEWERTKRAAEAALEDAKVKELENTRAKALREANNVLSRLEGAMQKMDAGMTSADLLKEEYLSEETLASSPVPVAETIEIPVEVIEDEPEVVEPGFAIPRIEKDGSNIGSIDIPILKNEASAVPFAAAAGVAGAAAAAATVAGMAGMSGIDTIIPKDVLPNKTASWEPPTLEEAGESEDVDYKEASLLIADVNKMLQSEIDRLSEGEALEPVEEKTEEPLIKIDPVATEEPEIEVTINLPEINEAEDDFILPTIAMPEDLFADETPAPIAEEPAVEPAVEEVTLEEEIQAAPVKDDLPVIADVVLEPEELAQLVNENVLSEAIKDEVPAGLDDSDLAEFSYFLPIKGMRNNIAQVLAGATHHLENPAINGGNIIVVGDRGAGKTQMATNIITVLQRRTGKPAGGIGKISGEKLNEKDIQKLFGKIQGGCLIIEEAGDITKETAVTFSLLMEHDTTGTIVIAEDDKKGIEKLLRLDGSFAKRFTEKIVIPTFSIDELVSFGKVYAEENGYTIDEMGILALYNRINAISRYDHATTIKEVATIMDDAMKHSAKGGFFNKAKVDRNGKTILREKDFDK